MKKIVLIMLSFFLLSGLLLQSACSTQSDAMTKTDASASTLPVTPTTSPSAPYAKKKAEPSPQPELGKEATTAPAAETSAAVGSPPETPSSNESQGASDSENDCQQCTRTLLTNLAKDLGLQITFHQSVPNQKCDVPSDLRSSDKFDAILRSQNLTFAEQGSAGIIIYARDQSPVVVYPFTLANHTSAEAVAAALKEILVSDSNHAVSAIKESNLLMVKCLESELLQVKAYVHSVDQEPAEVLIDYSVQSVAKEKAAEVGQQLATTFPLKDHLPLVNFLPSIGGYLLNSAQVSFLRSGGNIKQFATGNTTVQNGRTKVVILGRGANSFTLAPDSSTNLNIESGLAIELIPVVTHDGKVTLSMRLIVASPSPSGKGSYQQAVNVAATLPDNTTAILGKYRVATDGRSHTGIVGLDMIPILGRFVSIPKNFEDKQALTIQVSVKITKFPTEAPDTFQIRHDRSIREMLRGRR